LHYISTQAPGQSHSHDYMSSPHRATSTFGVGAAHAGASSRQPFANGADRGAKIAVTDPRMRHESTRMYANNWDFSRPVRSPPLSEAGWKDYPSIKMGPKLEIREPYAAVPFEVVTSDYRDNNRGTSTKPSLSDLTAELTAQNPGRAAAAMQTLHIGEGRFGVTGLSQQYPYFPAYGNDVLAPVEQGVGSFRSARSAITDDVTSPAACRLQHSSFWRNPSEPAAARGRPEFQPDVAAAKAEAARNAASRARGHFV